MFRLVFTIIETLRSRCGHLTANGKPRRAVCGSTLLAWPYLGLKIPRWYLAASMFVFIHSFTFISAEKLSLKIAFRRKNSITDNQKSSKSSVFSQMWDCDVVGCKKPWGKSPAFRAWSSRTNVNRKPQTWQQGTSHVTSWRSRFAGTADRKVSYGGHTQWQ